MAWVNTAGPSQTDEHHSLDPLSATAKDITLADVNALIVALNSGGKSTLTSGGNLQFGGKANNLIINIAGAI